MDKTHIGLVFQKAFDLTGGVHFVEDQINARMAVLERLEFGGQVSEQHRRHETDAQFPRGSLGGFRRDGHCRIELAKDARGLL